MQGRRFAAYFGVVSPPGTFDYSAQQLLEASADRVGIVQQMPTYAAAKYEDNVSDMRGRLNLLRSGIAGLRDAQAEIIGQFGGYWSLSYSPDSNSAKTLQYNLSQEFGVTVILAWTAIEDALRHVGARRIAVTTGYYRPTWTAATADYLTSAGFEVLFIGDLIDQGILANHQAKLDIEAATGWDYPDDIALQSCVESWKRASDCDAVLQCGAGMRTINVAAEVEKITGRPFVSTDTSFVWAMFKAAGIKAKSGNGSLLAGL